jgi:hypothetical protein
MIIIGQDKDIAVNFNNIDAIKIGNTRNQYRETIYARLSSDYFYKIGEYKTEERAEEVLRDIAHWYEIEAKVYRMPEE